MILVNLEPQESILSGCKLFFCNRNKIPAGMSPNSPETPKNVVRNAVGTFSTLLGGQKYEFLGLRVGLDAVTFSVA